MPKKLDSFVFPHGGRKGLDFDFSAILDGSVWQLEQGKDWTDASYDCKKFANAAARVANQMTPPKRVRRHIDGKIVTIQAVPQASTETAEA